MKKIMGLLIALFVLSAGIVSAAEPETKLCNKVGPGETALVAFTGMHYELKLLDVSGTAAKLNINGEITNAIAEDESYFTADFSELTVTDIAGNAAAFCINIVPELDTLSWFANPLKKGESTTLTYLNKDYLVKVIDISRTKAKLSVNGQIAELSHPKLGGKTTFVIDKDAMLTLGFIVEHDDALYVDFGVGEIRLPQPSPAVIDSRITATRKVPGAAEISPVQTPEETYGLCMRDLAKLKDDINKHYEAGEEVPEGLLEKYRDFEKHCAQMKPGTQSPVRALEAKEDCVGCLKQNGRSACIQLGTRLVENGVPAYCDFDGLFKAQKKLGENAQNNYECLSNTAADGKCVSIEERIQAVEKELKEQRNLIEKILDFFKGLFKKG